MLRVFQQRAGLLPVGEELEHTNNPCPELLKRLSTDQKQYRWDTRTIPALTGIPIGLLDWANYECLSLFSSSGTGPIPQCTESMASNPGNCADSISSGRCRVVDPGTRLYLPRRFESWQETVSRSPGIRLTAGKGRTGQGRCVDPFS